LDLLQLHSLALALCALPLLHSRLHYVKVQLTVELGQIGDLLLSAENPCPANQSRSLLNLRHLGGQGLGFVEFAHLLPLKVQVWRLASYLVVEVDSLSV